MVGDEMSQVTKKVGAVWNRWCLPVTLSYSFLLDVLIFYLGLGYDENIVQKYGYMVGCVLFAVFSGLMFLGKLREVRLPVRKLLFLALLLAFYIYAYVAAYLKFGIFEDLIFRGEIFIVLCLPLFFGGVYTALVHGEKKFFQIYEKLSVFILPAVLMYDNWLFFNNNPYWIRYLGVIDYMSFAYGVMPFLICHVRQFIRRESFTVPFLHISIPGIQYWRMFVIALYWVAMIGSGARGACVCVCAFLLLLCLSTAIHRKGFLSSLAVTMCMVGLFLFNLFVWCPAGMSGIHMMDVFVDNLSEGKLSTSNSTIYGDVDQVADILVAADGNQQVANRDGDNTSLRDVDYELTPENIAELNLGFSDRGVLFKLAWKEFLKSPVRGMGPYGFTYKYGMYPHNVVLEVLCETGIFGFLVLLVLTLGAIVRLIVFGRDNENIRHLLIIFLVYAVELCMSGSVWSCGSLLCAVSYGFLLQKQPLNLLTVTDGKRFEEEK